MPEKKKTGRDFPLAPTSMPQAVDNTYVKKPIMDNRPVTKYKYINLFKKTGEIPTSKDSLDYREGYKIGLSGKETSLFAPLAADAGEIEGKEKKKTKK